MFVVLQAHYLLDGLLGHFSVQGENQPDFRGIFRGNFRGLPRSGIDKPDLKGMARLAQFEVDFRPSRTEGIGGQIVRQRAGAGYFQ
jgi:hypothetical protein